MRPSPFNWVNLGVVAVLSLCAQQQADAQACADEVARLLSVEGTVEVLRSQQAGWSPVVQNDPVCVGDLLRSAAFSRAALLLANDTVIRLDQNTTLTFVEPEDAQKSWLELIQGFIHVISRERDALKIITPYANAGIEGTEFTIGVTEQQTEVTVLEGAVNLQNDAGELLVSHGESAAVRAGQVPVVTVLVRPRDAVQWAMYFVSVLDSGVAPDAPDELGDADFYTARAASRLAVGRVAEADDDIAAALALDAASADAFALLSAIAVSLNDTDAALAYAQQAQTADANSAAAAIAMSYAQQAVFDLNGARSTLLQSAGDNPDNALVWARLAEIQLSLGRIEDANEAAARAAALNPQLALTQTVLGFARLTELQLAAAEQAFTTATELAQSAPLPRLGLGLTLIRRGHLERGREQIEIAVLLDPNNSLLRSYMGKAYYEEKRDAKAKPQYRLAKELDPLDPTPWFYDAIRLQTINRPVEALGNLQQSIALNDNRAVYRSRLLLDQDLAARSASLARIYRNLGFRELATVEGATSVNTDPGNFSGHRFLADIYSDIPRHQIARVNELYQSQLLQPINITPVPPQLGQGSTFILDSAGPTDLAVNEFNPLFNRNRLAFQGSGVYGNNETWGNDAVLSGVWDRLSFSLGQFHFETDGFRENNDIEQDTLNAFVQYQLSPATSLLGELRTNEVDKGDLRLLFDPDIFRPSLRQDEKVDSALAGFRHEFSPASKLIGFYLHDELAQNTFITIPVLAADIEIQADADRDKIALHHIWQSQSWSLQTGGSYLNSDRMSETFRNGNLIATDDSDGDFASLYLYSNWQLGSTLTLTVGGSLNEIDVFIDDKSQFNPKFGLIWQPAEDTVVRGAAFRTLQDPGLSRQNIQPGLEPTQVAGFNQFYFGGLAEDARLYGIGLDQRLGQGVFAGAEGYLRRLEVPQDRPQGSTEPFDVDEDFATVYFNWAFLDRWAVNVEYRFEHIENQFEYVASSVQVAEDVRTSRVPIQFTYFSPIGITTSFTGTYVDQEVTYPDNSFVPAQIVDGADSFWICDLELSYRLPRRFGLLSLEVKNLFDEQFRFQDIDPENPEIIPERLLLGKLTINF